MGATNPLDRWLRVPEPWEIKGWAERARAAVERHFHQPQNQLLWGILALAAVLRLAFIDLIPFGAPQLTYLERAAWIVEGGFLGQGASAPASPQAPLVSYLLAILLLIGRDPRVLVAAIVALHLGAIAAIFRTAQRLLGLRTATIVAALLATNPWAVLSARSLTEPAVLIPATILTLCGLLSATAERRPWGWVGACVGAALLVNTSLLTLPVFVVLPMVAAIHRRRIRWMHLVLGLALLLLLSAPYLGQENLSRFREARTALRQMGSDLSSATTTLEAIRAAARVHAGQGLSALAAPSSEAYGGDAPTWRGSGLLAIAFLLSLIIMPLLAVTRWSKWQVSQDAAPYAIPSIWLLLALLTSPTPAAPVGTTALLWLLPIGIFAMGLIVDGFLGLPEKRQIRSRWWAPFARLALYIVCLGVLASQGYSVVRLYAHVDDDHDVSQGYGMPLRYWRRTAAMVRREAREEEIRQLWLIADTTTPTAEALPRALDYLLGDEVGVVTLGYDGSDSLLLPAARTGLYLISNPASKGAEAVRQMGGERRGFVLFPNEEPSVDLHVVAAKPVEELVDRIQTRGLWALDSGQRLLGYDWPPNARGGASVAMATHWTFLDVPTQEIESEHRTFVYLLDMDGQRVITCEGFGLEERHWVQGQLLKQWCTLDLPQGLPAGEYRLLVGSYRPSDGVRNWHIDPQGNRLGEAILLGPVLVLP